MHSSLLLLLPLFLLGRVNARCVRNMYLCSLLVSHLVSSLRFTYSTVCKRYTDTYCNTGSLAVLLFCSQVYSKKRKMGYEYLV